MTFTVPPGAVGLKLSTEDAGMSFGQMAAYAARFPSLDLYVKIGGPGARNDIAEAMRLGARCVVAPMVESAYAVEDFVAAVAAARSSNGFPDGAAPPALGVNIETASAVERVEAILEAAGARLSIAVVGRGDLARSCGRQPDDAEVIAAARRVVDAARARGLRTSVGGGVTPAGARRVIDEVGPDLLNTRLFVLDPARGEIGAAVEAALEAEIACLEADAAEGLAPPAAASGRIAEIRRRLRA